MHNGEYLNKYEIDKKMTNHSDYTNVKINIQYMHVATYVYVSHVRIT